MATTATVGETLESSRTNKFSMAPIVATLVVTAMLLLVFVDWSRTDPPARVPHRYVLAEGFTGNVKIVYDVEGEPPIPTVDGFRVLEIPRSGLLRTSSEMEFGRAQDVFVRHQADGGFQELNEMYLKRRTNGRLGDRKEYFESAKELDERDNLYREQGLLNEDGTNILKNPYELFVIRDDFEEIKPN